jgi:hypothetical protein
MLTHAIEIKVVNTAWVENAERVTLKGFSDRRERLHLIRLVAKSSTIMLVLSSLTTSKNTFVLYKKNGRYVVIRIGQANSEQLRRLTTSIPGASSQIDE